MGACSDRSALLPVGPVTRISWSSDLSHRGKVAGAGGMRRVGSRYRCFPITAEWGWTKARHQSEPRIVRIRGR